MKLRRKREMKDESAQKERGGRGGGEGRTCAQRKTNSHQWSVTDAQRTARPGRAGQVGPVSWAGPVRAGRAGPTGPVSHGETRPRRRGECNVSHAASPRGREAAADWGRPAGRRDELEGSVRISEPAFDRVAGQVDRRLGRTPGGMTDRRLGHFL
jgi:hypothetical protein